MNGQYPPELHRYVTVLAGMISAEIWAKRTYGLFKETTRRDYEYAEKAW